jgi:hypothetical protein
VLPAGLGVITLECEHEAVGDGDTLAESDDEAESRREAELTNEAVVRGAVAVAASEALASEAEEVGEGDCDCDMTGEVEEMGLPLTLSQLLLLADAQNEALEHCETVDEGENVGEEVRVSCGEALLHSVEEVEGELVLLSASPREGDKSAEADARRVALPAMLGVGTPVRE